MPHNIFPLSTKSIWRQKAHSNRMRCWCPRAVSSITSTTKAGAGSSLAGTQPPDARALNVDSDYVLSLCSCLAVSACSLELNSCAALSILKVIYNFFHQTMLCQMIIIFQFFKIILKHILYNLRIHVDVSIRWSRFYILITNCN